ncbi:MAG: TolC family protein [Gemmatimonadales bacterium]
MKALAALMFAFALAPASTFAQAPVVPRPAPTATLTLAQALEQAQRMSPTYRQTLNDAGAARWAVRNAYGNMLVPSVSVGGSVGYTGSGAATFGGSLFNQSSPSLTSGYGLQLDWTVSGATVSAPGQQKANQRAVGEDLNNALVSLRFEIVFQYLTALQGAAQTDVARQQVARNADFLALAQARYQVGQATILDVKQAQVQKGQADVTLLRANQTENEAKLELYRRIGLNAPNEIETVGLPDSFPVTEPTWRLEQLLGVAAEQNPALRATRARETSADFGLKSQRSRYLPSLSFSAGWNGFTQEFTNSQLLLNSSLARAQGALTNCNFQNSLVRSLPGGGIGGVPGAGTVGDCKAFVGLDATGNNLDPAVEAAIRKANNAFPFSFTSQPFSARVQVSLPIFDGFQRDLSVSQARAQRDDLRESVRARSLQVRTDVQARFLGTQTAYRAIAVQVQNRDAARDQLQLAQDRYRLGSGSALEVSDAQNAVQRAEGDYVNAVYEYHKAIAALELAVGRPLR